MYKGRTIHHVLPAPLQNLKSNYSISSYSWLGNSGWKVPISVPHSPLFLQQITYSCCLDCKDASGEGDMWRISRFVMKNSGYISDSTNFCKDFILIIMHALRQF